jgi:hypothetical protein
MFFDAALKKEWKEGQEKAIELYDIDINAFRVWVKWLYTGQFSTQEKADIVKSASSADNSAWDLLRSVYALGDYLQDTNFKDAMIDDMASRCVLSQRHPDLAASYIYPFSSPESPHRQLAIDICVFAWSVEEYRSLRTKKSEEFPPEFLTDVVVYMGEMLAGNMQTKFLLTMLASRNVWKYHKHGGKDKKCYKQKRMSLFGES